MKKNFKLVLALVLAAMMIVSMIPAMAEDTYKIDVDSNDTHTYAVYQILTGELSENSKTLSNVNWGSSVNAPTEGKINNKTATEFAKDLESMSGVDVVAEVAKYFTADTATTDPAKKVGTVTKDSPLQNLVAGYYVMVDVTNPLQNKDEDGNVLSEDTLALNVVKVINNVTVTKKWGTTQNTKTISADTLGKDSGKNEYTPGRDNDNVSIGDTVEYTLTATVPENADKFKDGTFFFVITDKLSSGLDFTTGSIKVYDGDDTELTEDTNYTVQYNINGNTFEIGMINAASYKGQTLKVTYSAVLNKDAVIGDAGNPNTSTVKYSNNPNQTYEGSPEDKDHKGFPDSTKNVPTGETPEQKTITYTTAIEILKVDEDGGPLTKDVKFELTGTSVKKVVTKTTTFTAYTAADEANAADYKYYKLNDGTYTMTEPTKDKMVDAEVGASKGYVEDDSATGDDAITVDGKTYRPYDSETDADAKIYVLQEGSEDAYEDIETKYKKTVTEKTVDSDATDHKMEEVPDSNGIVRFDGLGAGTYKLEETQYPDGYNKAEDVNLTVSYNADSTAKFSVTGGTAAYEDGVIKIKIVNKKGATLPETGGVGTTIFYIAGSILVLAAAILLVTKRRMGSED